MMKTSAATLARTGTDKQQKNAILNDAGAIEAFEAD